MKKLIFLIFLFMVVIQNQSFADAVSGNVESVFGTVATPTTTVVAGTGATIVSRTFRMSSVRTPNIGYWLKLAPGVSSGTSNVALYTMTSPDDSSGSYATVSTITYATNNTATSGTIAYPYMKYVKFRATGLTGQATDSTITAYVFTQE